MDGDTHVQTAVTEISILVIYHFFVELFSDFFLRHNEENRSFVNACELRAEVELFYTFIMCEYVSITVCLEKCYTWLLIYLFTAFCLLH